MLRRARQRGQAYPWGMAKLKSARPCWKLIGCGRVK
jgi:hypothetical protein